MPTITYNPETREYQCVIDDEGTTLIARTEDELKVALRKLETWKRERDAQ